MLAKEHILSLRDLALAHLPRVRDQRDEAFNERGRIAALQAVASSPEGIQYNPASTVVEDCAAQILRLVGDHPETHTWDLVSPEVPWDDAIGVTKEMMLSDAEGFREQIDAELLKWTLRLCDLTQTPTPPWLANVQQRPPGGTKPWQVIQPKRFQGYREALHTFLKEINEQGAPVPTARDVLAAWKVSAPSDVFNVTNKGFEYNVANGTKKADLDAIAKSIKNLISADSQRTHS